MNQFASGSGFTDTNWEYVELLSNRAKPDDRALLLEHVLDTCKNPLYTYLRAKGYSKEDSEDHLQSFFLEAHKTHLLSKANQQSGKLRSFLLGSMNLFLARKYRHDTAQKRGGHILHESIHEIEEKDTKGYSPDQIYDQAWTKTLLDRSLEQLKHENQSEDNLNFTILMDFLSWNSRQYTYKNAATLLDITIPALKSRVFRMRVRFKEILRLQVAQTFTSSTPNAIDEELSSLKQSWNRIYNGQ